MKSALIHGVLLAVMLVYGYRTWTRDTSVKPDLGSVVLWNKAESELVAIEYKSEKKTVRLDHKSDGQGAYWWGTETSVEKKPKPKPPEKKPDAPAEGSAAGSGSGSQAAGSGSAKAGSGSQVAAGSGSGSASAKTGSAGSGSQVAAGSGSAKAGSGSGSAGSGSQVAAGSGSGSGSGSAAKPPTPPVEMVETTKRREFPLGDGGDKLIATYTDARALGEFGTPTADQLVDYKLATVAQIETKLAEVKKELEQVKATEAADKELEKDEPKDGKKKGKKDDKKPELTKKIKELEDLKKATDGKPKTTLTVTFKDGTSRVFQVGGAVFGPSGDRYVLDSQSGVAYVLKKEMLSGLEVGESSLQLTDPRGFDATKIEQVEIDWNGRKKLAKRTQTADASDKQVKTWTDADTGKANQPMATFIDNVNNLRPTEYAKDVKVDGLTPIFRIEYRDASAKLGTLSLYKVEKAPVIPDGGDFDPANPPKGEIEYYVVTERTRVPALVRRDPAKKSEDDLPIVFGDKAAPVAPKPGANPFGNVPIKGGPGGPAAPSPLGGAPGKDPHGH